MIFDMHMHIENRSSWIVTAEDCIRAMDEASVDKAAVMTLGDYPGLNPDAIELVTEAMSRYPDRLYGLARLHPGHLETSQATLDRAVTHLGFVGLKLHPVSTHQHPAGEATIALVRQAGELGVPTLFHCGDEHMTTPLAIAETAAACPGSVIMLGHMGGYFHVDEALQVAERYPNVVLETSAMPYPEKIIEAVRRVGAERVVFGSDGPVASPIVEKQKVVIAALGADDAALVLGGNAARMLRLGS
ncbi:hypothetical protein GCM10011575_14350 [Microlunatus endophyticus]|uniref:Amidohydrolase-related domain-containing protein n=2 Tax=Microlunatus endophyticus TaxID=1716077 RepID=A0A917W2Y3_9ACTN|nr:hypothetical protein GCM10011575_14350 [Microlunatus endophyticus]